MEVWTSFGDLRSGRPLRDEWLIFSILKFCGYGEVHGLCSCSRVFLKALRCSGLPLRDISCSKTLMRPPTVRRTGTRAESARSSCEHSLTSKVTKDEGLLSSILKCLTLRNARQLWNVNHFFFKVLKSSVVPVLALVERDWRVVSQYMDLPEEGCGETSPRFGYRYSLDKICVEAVFHQDFSGLRLLSRRGYDFRAVQKNEKLKQFALEALWMCHFEDLFLLRAIDFDFSDLLSKNFAKHRPISERVFIEVDGVHRRLIYTCWPLDFVTSNFIEWQLGLLCCRKSSLFMVPFVMAAFIHAGASPCSFIRPSGCGYLLLLAIASESFNFVYPLAVESVHLQAVFDMYKWKILRMIDLALQHRRFVVLKLFAFCEYSLPPDDDVQQQFDEPLLTCLLAEDLIPIERLCCVGFSLRRFAERNLAEFKTFVQSRLELDAAGRPGLNEAIVWLASLDRSALELHFESSNFLEFVQSVWAKGNLGVLRQILEVHPNALDSYFARHYATFESLLIDAFVLRDVSLIVDIASIGFPLRAFFIRNQAEVDAVLMHTWFGNKNWTALKLLRLEVKQWSFVGFFERNCARSDTFALAMIRNGYWFDLHNLSSLSFDFPSLFRRRFNEVAATVLDVILTPHPHFVLLRELSSLDFPWDRFMEVHGDQLMTSTIQNRDFLEFVISLDGFELGSKVYAVVEEMRRFYRSMAASMFNASIGFRESSPVIHTTVDTPTNVKPSTGKVDAPVTQATVVRALRRGFTSRAGQGPSDDEPRSSRLRRSRSRLNTKKVLMLMVRKGLYRWNPLKADLKERDEKGAPRDFASEIELVVGAWEMRDEDALPGHVSDEDRRFFNDNIELFWEDLSSALPAAPSAERDSGSSAPGDV